jgi:hypothetical protein
MPPEEGDYSLRSGSNDNANTAVLSLRLRHCGWLKRTFTLFRLGIARGLREWCDDDRVLAGPGSRFPRGREQRREKPAAQECDYGDAPYHSERSKMRTVQARKIDSPSVVFMSPVPIQKMDFSIASSTVSHSHKEFP